jgi:hypothetical protein
MDRIVEINIKRIIEDSFDLSKEAPFFASLAAAFSSSSSNSMNPV